MPKTLCFAETKKTEHCVGQLPSNGGQELSIGTVFKWSAHFLLFLYGNQQSGAEAFEFYVSTERWRATRAATSAARRSPDCSPLYDLLWFVEMLNEDESIELLGYMMAGKGGRLAVSGKNFWRPCTLN